MPDSVFSAGGGRSSVEAWYTSSLDIEEVLAGAADSHVHLFVADVVKSFDTVDRGILDCILSNIGLLAWFRHAYFEYHLHVRLRFKLAAGLGEWTRDCGIPQGCPLSMMFIVAFFLALVSLFICSGGELSLSCMLIILSAYLGTLTCFCMLPGSPLGMFGWLAKSLRLVWFIVFSKWWVRVVLVMVPSIFSLLALLRLVSGGIPLLWLGLGPVCPCLVIWLAPFSTSRLLFLMPGGTRLQLIFVMGRFFAVGPCWIFYGSLRLLNSSHVRERDKGLLRSVMVGGVWNGFLLSRFRCQPVPMPILWCLDGDGHLFWECTFPPLVETGENSEFHDLMREDRARWPRCLLGHGWLPMLSVVNGALRWADGASESALYLVEVALGRCSSGLVAEWGLPDGFYADEVAAQMPDDPEVWSDGSLILDSTTGVSAAGAGIFAHQSELCWSGRRWCHVDRVLSNYVAHSCRGFLSVPGLLQTVQRAELWERSFLLFSLPMLFMWGR